MKLILLNNRLSSYFIRSFTLPGNRSLNFPVKGVEFFLAWPYWFEQYIITFSSLFKNYFISFLYSQIFILNRLLNRHQIMIKLLFILHIRLFLILLFLKLSSLLCYFFFDFLHFHLFKLKRIPHLLIKLTWFFKYNFFY